MADAPVEVVATAIAYCIFDQCALLLDELTYNRYASTQGHNKGPCGRDWGGDD